ncbi:MAG: FAD-dependent oxidoreductase [Candidatus Verstraetearchaeota archaeon]|nr:FAD-dependent oxidoreductase [Candidatus Verstraetearchaeota archaeon]
MKFEVRAQEIIRRTADVKSFRFSRPDGFNYDPGQFMLITVPVGGDRKTKPLTVSSSPTEDFIEFTKKITSHEFSAALDELRVGDTVQIDGPYGNFTFKGERPKVGMISGGIGITPLRSMIKYCTDKGVESNILLLYGNRSEESIAFKDEFDRLEEANRNLRVVHALSRPGEGWKGRREHIDLQMIQEEVPDYAERVFYVCGPPALVTDCVNHLKALRVPAEKIRVENFPGY